VEARQSRAGRSQDGVNVGCAFLMNFRTTDSPSKTRRSRKDQTRGGISQEAFWRRLHQLQGKRQALDIETSGFEGAVILAAAFRKGTRSHISRTRQSLFSQRRVSSIRFPLQTSRPLWLQYRHIACWTNRGKTLGKDGLNCRASIRSATI